jgi:hypothetical protein
MSSHRKTEPPPEPEDGELHDPGAGPADDDEDQADEPEGGES